MGRTLEKIRYPVDGTQYYQENVMKLATLNPEWDTAGPAEDRIVKVFKYNFKNKPMALEDDPDFPGQYKVVVDGLKVGCLRKSATTELKQREIKYTSAFIHGGPVKSIGTGGDVVELEDRISVSVSVGYVVGD